MHLARLKELLETHGITQAELARLLKRDRAVITNLMYGRRNLKANEAVTIANYLNVPVSDLLGLGNAEALAEPSVIPFQHAPSAASRKSRHIIKKKGAYFLETEHASGPKMFALEVRDESLNLAGFLPGDIVIADMDRPLVEGDVAVIQHYHEEDNAETILRRYSPPLLLPHSTQPQFVPLKEKDKSVRIVAPVVKLMRFF